MKTVQRQTQGLYSTCMFSFAQIGLKTQHYELKYSLRYFVCLKLSEIICGELIFLLLWSMVVRRASSVNFWCLHSRDHICVLTISRGSSNMGHVGSKFRSPDQILGTYCLHSKRPHLRPDFDGTCSQCFFWQFLGKIRIWVMLD